MSVSHMLGLGSRKWSLVCFIRLYRYKHSVQQLAS